MQRYDERIKGTITKKWVDIPILRNDGDIVEIGRLTGNNG